MKRKFLLCSLLLVTLGAALSATLHWRARSLEANLNASLKRHREAIDLQRHRRAQLNESLSHHRTTGQSELLKLRGEVAELRRSTTNLYELKTALDNLHNEVQAARTAVATNAPAASDPSKIRASWTKDQITFAGYADENSALQSTLWAMNRGELSAMLSALAPGAVTNLWRDANPNPTAADKDGTSPAAIKERDAKLARLAASLRPVTAFHLVSNNVTPRIPNMNPAYQIYKVYFEGDGATRGLGFKKVGNELKFVAVYALGGTDEHPTYEANLWP
jgi:hypothetical protein